MENNTESFPLSENEKKLISEMSLRHLIEKEELFHKIMRDRHLNNSQQTEAQYER